MGVSFMSHLKELKKMDYFEHMNHFEASRELARSVLTVNFLLKEIPYEDARMSSVMIVENMSNLDVETLLYTSGYIKGEDQYWTQKRMLILEDDNIHALLGVLLETLAIKVKLGGNSNG